MGRCQRDTGLVVLMEVLRMVLAYLTAAQALGIACH